jgi:superfamily II helicase
MVKLVKMTSERGIGGQVRVPEVCERCKRNVVRYRVVVGKRGRVMTEWLCATCAGEDLKLMIGTRKADEEAAQKSASAASCG